MNRRELLAAGAAALVLPGRALAGGSGGSPIVLVTADLESHVAAVDVGTGRVVRRIRTPPGPRSIEGAFMTWAVVAHTASGRLSILDGPTLRLRRVVEGFREPRYTAIHPSRWPSDSQPGGTALAYVTDSARREVVTVDVGRGAILWRTPVPGPARHVTVDAEGRLLFAALGSKAERVAVVALDDPRRPRLVRAFATPFLAHDVVCDPSGDQLWVTSGSARRVAIYERAGRRPVESIPAGAPPQHVALGDRGAAYIASGDDGTLRLHTRAGALLEELRVPHGSYNVCSPGAATRLGAVTPSLGGGTLALIDRSGAVAVRQVARAAHDACLVVSA